MSNHALVRAATVADVPALTALADRVHQLHVAAMPHRYAVLSREQIAAVVTNLVADPAQSVLVADVDGELVGYVVVRRVEPTPNVFAIPRLGAHVDQLGVRDDAQRGGHGRALMVAAEELARSWGAVSVSLDVQAFNDGARRFYEAIGYAAVRHRMVRPLG